MGNCGETGAAVLQGGDHPRVHTIFGEGAQLALFQILRESIDQSVRRGTPSRILAWVKTAENGSAELVVADDGPPERRAAVLEALAERAATLNARFSSEVSYPRGSTIRIELPQSAASR